MLVEFRNMIISVQNDIIIYYYLYAFSRTIDLSSNHCIQFKLFLTLGVYPTGNKFSTARGMAIVLK